MTTHISSISKNKKNVSIEILRIIAIFFVIFNHTWGITAFTSVPLGGKRWLVYSSISLFCKMSVPVFFMISGAMLLGRNEPMKKIAMRIGKSVLELCLITLLYILYKFFQYGAIYGVKDYFIYLYQGNGLSAHLWFMYAYIAFLISIPLLEGIVSILNKKKVCWILGCVLTYQSLSFIQYVFGSNIYVFADNANPSWMMSNIVLYPVIGWWIYNNDFIKTKKVLLYSNIMIILGVVLPMIELYFLGDRNGGTYDGVWVQQFHNHFVFLIAIGLFLAMKIWERIQLFQKNNIKNMILKLGGTTYGVYIIHIMVKDLPINKHFLDWMLTDKKIEAIIAILIYVAVTYIVSVFAIRIIQIAEKVLLRIAKKWLRRKC